MSPLHTPLPLAGDKRLARVMALCASDAWHVAMRCFLCEDMMRCCRGAAI